MGKQRTVHGKYSTDDLGRDGSGPIKVTEMDKNRTKNFTVMTVSALPIWLIATARRNSNWGLAASIKRKR